jgi:hypothetical protein
MSGLARVRLDAESTMHAEVLVDLLPNLRCVFLPALRQTVPHSNLCMVLREGKENVMDARMDVRWFALIVLFSPNVLGQSCATAEGSWTWIDPFETLIYTLSQNSSGTINGTVRTNFCAVKDWPMQGTFTGNGLFNARATNPTGGVGDNCAAAWFEIEGSVDKPGCHTGSGTWVNSIASDSWNWSKPCEVPTGESTTPIGWNSGEPTIFRWLATLAPSSKNFDGRTVTESVNTGDGCWFPGSIFAEVTGSPPNPATVSGNTYADDIGWVPAAVTYYRSQSRAPCSFSSVQQMRIDCLTSTPSFISNGLGGTVGTTTVSSSRAGQTQTRTWP